MKFVYAAYRKGAFEKEIPQGLSPTQFSEFLKNQVLTIDAAWIIEGPDIPSGLAIAFIRENRMEPHVYWFPWASPRNKLESHVNFFQVMRKIWTIIIYSEPKDHKYFKHIERYGVIRQVGKINKYFPNGDAASLFQTRDED